MSHFAILLPPPCTNASLHLGHLSGVYIPGDVYARYLSLKGHDVLTICGADQNNTYTKAKADALSLSFDETKKSFADKIEEALEQAGIRIDAYENTDTDLHRSIARDIVKRLRADDIVRIQPEPRFHCSHCDLDICDTEVTGICGRCGAGAECGICENCNTFIYDRFLLEAKHKACEKPCHTVERKVLTFDLDACKDRFRDLVLQSHWDPRLKYKVLEYLSRGQSEHLVMTNAFPGGIEIDDPELEARHLGIWFEATWNLFTGLAACFECGLDGVLEKLNEDDYKLVPFMGQDTEFCYSVGLSAVLLGLGYEQVYDQVVIQRFVKLDGSKFSSSRNHVIFLDELTKDIPVDVIRLYSLSVLLPYFEDDNNFVRGDLRKLNEEFRNFQERVAELAKGSPREMPRSLSSENARKHLEQYHAAMEGPDFRGAYLSVMGLMDSVKNQADGETLHEDLFCLLLMLKPIMPGLSAELGSELFGEAWPGADFQGIG